MPAEHSNSLELRLIKRAVIEMINLDDKGEGWIKSNEKSRFNLIVRLIDLEKNIMLYIVIIVN